jgi:hypothetical protein
MKLRLPLELHARPVEAGHRVDVHGIESGVGNALCFLTEALTFVAVAVQAGV